jgi:hypothetical protein
MDRFSVLSPDRGYAPEMLISELGYPIGNSGQERIGSARDRRGRGIGLLDSDGAGSVSLQSKYFISFEGGQWHRSAPEIRWGRVELACW